MLAPPSLHFLLIIPNQLPQPPLPNPTIYQLLQQLPRSWQTDLPRMMKFAAAAYGADWGRAMGIVTNEGGADAPPMTNEQFVVRLMDIQPQDILRCEWSSQVGKQPTLPFRASACLNSTQFTSNYNHPAVCNNKPLANTSVCVRSVCGLVGCTGVQPRVLRGAGPRLWPCGDCVPRHGECGGPGDQPHRGGGASARVPAL
jgi:hypothetical protein